MGRKKTLTFSVVVSVSVLLLLLSPSHRPRYARARSTYSGHRSDCGATLQRWSQRRSNTGRGRRGRRGRRGSGGRGSRGRQRGRSGRGRRPGGSGPGAVGGHGTVLAVPRPTVPATLAVIIVRRVQTLAAVPTWVRRTMIPVNLSTRRTNKM